MTVSRRQARLAAVDAGRRGRALARPGLDRLDPAALPLTNYLAGEPDIVKLRQAMGTAQAKAGQAPGASGGNSSKRIRRGCGYPAIASATRPD